MAAVFCVGTDAAFAEVCDKARPDWNPADGPVTMVNEAGSLLLSPVGLGLVGLLTLGWILRNRWLSGLCCIGALAFLAFVLAQDSDNEVWDLAVREGCMHPSSSVIDAGLLILISVLAGLAFRRFRYGDR